MMQIVNKFMILLLTITSSAVDRLPRLFVTVLPTVVKNVGVEFTVSVLRLGNFHNLVNLANYFIELA